VNSENKLEFNCIYSKDAFTVKKFLKNIENDCIINYMDIINKLTKNDIYSNEPSDIIVGSYIIKQLEKLLIEKGKLKLYYVMSNMEIEVIENLKDYVFTLINKEFVYNVYLDDIDNFTDMLHYFDNVLNLNNQICTNTEST